MRELLCKVGCEVSPFVTMSRAEKMLQTLGNVSSSGTKITVVTRPVYEYAINDQARIAQVVDMLREHSIIVVERLKIHYKFAVIDGRTAWYGSINLLSFGDAEESIMRLESKGISEELLKQVNIAFLL